MNNNALQSPIEIDPPSSQKKLNFAQEKEEIPLTFKDFTNTYLWPNMGSLRKMAYESESNGLSPAFVKLAFFPVACHGARNVVLSYSSRNGSKKG